MIGDNWKIYWNNYCNNSYTYGSEVVFLKKKMVAFNNELMAPGVIINEWFSKTQFQIDLIEPSLPIIDGENTYELITNIDCNENEQWLIRVVFYDKFDKEVGVENIWDNIHVFRCPYSTYWYKIQLINAGLKKLCFKFLELREIPNESEKNPKEDKKKTKNNKRKDKYLF